MTEREKLIEDLKEICKVEKLDKDGLPYEDYEWAEDKIADFILADRKRIVHPLIKWKKEMNSTGKWPDPYEAIDETLKLAGILE